MPQEKKVELDLRCLDCGTDLQRDRFEYVCPSDGHRFQEKDGQIIHSVRQMYGPGPDGVADRRRYPSLEGGQSRRTVKPDDHKPRGFDPIDAEMKRAAAEQRR